MSKDNNNLVLDIIKNKAILIIATIAIFVGAIYVLFVIDGSIKAPIPQIASNIKATQQLKDDIAQKKKNLERIISDNKAKNEAAKKATVKDFYKVENPSGDPNTDLAPLFDNIITLIKENGLRMKSIQYSVPPDDNLIKNGGGAYSGCKVDFRLVGYYPQFAAFLNELANYPYFINISEFKTEPYQYDKRILITDVSIIFYSKR